MSTVKTDIYFDAQGECIVIRRVDGAGEVIEDVPQVRLSLGDLQNAGQPDEMPIQAVFRRVHYTAEDGSKKRCYGLLTIPEDDATSDGHDSTEEDLRIGGGGGGDQRYRVKLVGGSWLGCHRMNGTTEGGYSAVSAAVVSGASGYSVGQILTVSGGTFSTAAILVVTAISGGGTTGPITAVSIVTSGNYSVTPGNPVAVATGSATFNVVWTPKELLYATVSTAGTGYAVGDILTISGGTCTTAATVMVSAISGGLVTGPIVTVAVVNPGKYTVLPTSPNTPTGGNGSACALTLFFTAAMTYIAKTPELRSFHGLDAGWYEVIEGATITYIWGFRPANADGQRVASADGATSQTEIVIPIWHVGETVDGADGQWSEIWAFAPTGGVGPDPDGEVINDPFGNAIMLMDRNASARRWNYLPPPPA